MPLPVGKNIGRYKVLSLLGAGGMGEVYLAEDSELGRAVALKVLPENVARDKQGMQRFIREVRTTSALNHPNILTIFEIGHTDSTHFIATEFIEGDTLRQHLNNKRMKLSDALNVSIQTADALSAAHEANIIHRDLKPENIMLRRRDDYVKVLDFGLAKLIEQPPITVDTEAATKALFKTEDGVILGTVIYMSPEQARGLEVDARTDIWSLGVVLYEMVAGCLPFEGATKSEILASILNEKEPPPLARFAREVPAELERIVEKALRKDREERYQTAKDILLDLRRLKHKLDVDAEIERTVPPELRGATGEAPPSGGEEAFSTAQASATQAATVESAPTTSSAEYIITEIKRHKRGVAAVLAAIILLSITGVAYYFYSARSGSRGAIDSIAVLPLVNTSNDPNLEYLSDGISESLINSLTELQQLRVVARTTVFRYKGKEVNPQAVGRELNVRAVLMGRVRQLGDALDIQVDLVDASTGAELWGEKYERKVSDALSVKQTIAREVTEKLRLRLSGEDERRLVKRDTTNAEAYQFYLRGRYFWNKRTADGLKKAIEQFQQAIDRDPNYALGYVGLADCYGVLETVAGVPASESLPKARAAADRALQLDDSLSEAHTSSAHIYEGMWRWTEAEAEYRRAISLNPNYPTAHHWFAYYLMTKRQFDDAMRESKRAQEIDPLSPVISNNVAYAYLLKNDINSAIEQCQRMIELDPNFPAAHETLGIAYLKQQRDEEAIAEFQKAVGLSNKSSYFLRGLGYCYAVTGKRTEALQIVKELEDRYARREAIGWYVASVYAGLGDKDPAFAWLEKDFQQHSALLTTMTWFFTVGDLRSDLRYADLVRRMGLTP
jgi:serine/threonine protein kinase/Tfp pilus assembly protein PilF